MKIRKKITAGLLALAASVMISGAVFAKPEAAYDRRDSVVLEQQRAASKAQAKERSKLAWQKINGVCYNGSGEKIDGAITRGIDISEWQDTINWNKVAKSNVDFAFIRISYGRDYLDKKYDQNMRGANAAGLPVGTYVYSLAMTPGEAIQEAQLAISKMQGYKISYPVVFDLEYEKMRDKLSKSEITDLAIAFCAEVKKAGYYPMVYCNANWYKNVVDMSRLKEYDCWLAIYGDKIPAPSHDAYDYTIWQCTDGFSGGLMQTTRLLIDGLAPNDNVDMNFGFVDYTKKITPRTKARDDYVPTKVVRDGWAQENGQTYYYQNGKRVTGRKKIGNDYYRFSTTDGHLYRSTTLFSKKSNTTVYVNENGAEVSNTWITYKNKKYYFGSNHQAYKGSRNVGGKFYYFHTKYGYAMTNWKLVTSKKVVYYYDENGVRFRSGFRTIDEKGKKNTYYFASNGQAYAGWHTIKGKRYYFYGRNTSKNSIRAEGVTLKIGKWRCVFNKDGVCTRRTVIK